MSNSDSAVCLRAHAFAFLLAGITCGALCGWYGFTTLQIYDKLRDDDLYLPEKLRELAFRDLSGPAAAAAAVAIGDEDVIKALEDFKAEIDSDVSRVMKRGGGGSRKLSVPYFRLLDTDIQPVMPIFENSLWALKLSNLMCMACGGFNLLAAVWFIIAHCLVFERSGAAAASAAAAVINVISFVVYMLLLAANSAMIVLLALRITMLPVMRTLAETIPLTMEHTTAYDDYQLMSKLIVPFLLANLFLVVVLASWFQARLANAAAFTTSTCDTKAMSIKRKI